MSGCGGCRAAEEARQARARVLAESMRGGADAAVAAAAAPAELYEVFWANGQSSGRRFTTSVAAAMFVGKRDATIRRIR